MKQADMEPITLGISLHCLLPIQQLSTRSVPHIEPSRSRFSNQIVISNSFPISALSNFEVDKK